MTDKLTPAQCSEITTHINSLEHGTISDYIDARTWVENRYKLTFSEYLKITSALADKVGIDFDEPF